MPTKILARLFAASLAACAALPGTAHAQVGAFSDYMPSGTDQFNYVLNSIVMQSVFDNAERQASQRASAKAATGTVVGLDDAPRIPQKLAQRYPPERRGEAAKTFREMLDGYHQIEARLDIPRGDLAGALAALIAGSMIAYHDRDVPDADFQKLVRQLRAAIGQDPGFARIDAAGRQEAYEQFAILGTYLALTRTALQRRPDAQTRSRMREAARGYLGQFGLDPERIEITSQGLIRY